MSAWSEQLVSRFAESVKRRRKELNLSAQDVADRTAELGHPVNRSAIAAWENHGRGDRLMLGDALALAEVLDIPLLDILADAGTPDGRTYNRISRDRDAIHERGAKRRSPRSSDSCVNPDRLLQQATLAHQTRKDQNIMIDTITLTGGVVAEPELRFTNSGAAVCSFRIAQSDHKKNEAGEWERTQALYLTVSIWDDRPERRNPVAWAQEAANLTVGQPIAVKGKLITRTWQAKDGTNRSQVEFAATEFYIRPAQSAAPAQTGGFGQQQDPWGSQPQSTGSGHHVAPAGGGVPAGPPVDDEVPF